MAGANVSGELKNPSHSIPKVSILGVETLLRYFAWFCSRYVRKNPILCHLGLNILSYYSLLMSKTSEFPIDILFILHILKLFGQVQNEKLFFVKSKMF